MATTTTGTLTTNTKRLTHTEESLPADPERDGTEARIIQGPAIDCKRIVERRYP